MAIKNITKALGATKPSSEGVHKIKFDQVAGVDEAKGELVEIVEFLK